MSLPRPRVLAWFAAAALSTALLAACSTGSSSTTGTATGTAAAELTPTGPAFEVVVLDDQPDPFANLDPPLPAGISSFQEPVIFSPEDIQGRTYVRLVIQPGETFPRAMARAKPWFDARKLPSGDRLVFSQIIEENEITKQREPVGARTYVATSQVVLTTDDVATATVGAAPDRDQKPQPVAMLQLTPLATERFRKFTKENVFKRIAVMSHGNVFMVALIQEEIGAGTLSISADPEQPYELKRAELQRFVDAIKPKAPAAPK